MAWTQKRTFAVGGVLLGVLVLYVLGSEKQRNESGTPGSEPAANPGQCRVTVTADVLNIRAAPDLGAKIVDKFNRGQQTDADRTVQNGFRKIGENRWISTRYISPMSGRDCG